MILPHRTLASFWARFDALPAEVQAQAEAAYAEWLDAPRSPGLRFKRIAGDHYSARIGRDHRAVCRVVGDEWQWFWIGHHRDYEKLLKGLR